MDFKLAEIIFGLCLLNLGCLHVNGAKSRKESNAGEGDFKKNLFKNYDKDVRPNATGPPVDVDVTMHIQELKVSDAKQEIETTLYLRLFWQDERLTYDSYERITLSSKSMDKIWQPDLFFSNDIETRKHSLIKEHSMIRISPDGSILLSKRITSRLGCKMDFTSFPFDRQNCSISIESYAYPTEDLIMRFPRGTNSISRSTGSMSSPCYTVLNVTSESSVEELSTGTYQRLAVHFYLMRITGHLILNLIVPSSLMVVFSWFTFWIHHHEMTSRILIGVFSMSILTILTFYPPVFVPKTAYFTKLNVWNYSCLFLVTLTFLETFLIHMISKNDKIALTRAAQFQEELVHAIDMKGRKFEKKIGIRTSRIDLVSRFVFPVIFILFAVSYFFTSLYF